MGARARYSYGEGFPLPQKFGLAGPAMRSRRAAIFLRFWKTNLFQQGQCAAGPWLRHLPAAAIIRIPLAATATMPRPTMGSLGPAKLKLQRAGTARPTIFSLCSFVIRLAASSV